LTRSSRFPAGPRGHLEKKNRLLLHVFWALEEKFFEFHPKINENTLLRIEVLE